MDLRVSKDAGDGAVFLQPIELVDADGIARPAFIPKATRHNQLPGWHRSPVAGSAPSLESLMRLRPM